MSRIVEYQGTEHEFPDEFTDQDVSSALSSYDKQQGINRVQEALSRSPSGLINQLPKEIAGGLLNSVVQMGKQLPNIGFYKEGERPVDKIDPYKTMGTEEKPWYTPGGAAQVGGELLGGAGEGLVKGIGGGINLLKKGIERISPAKTGVSLAEHLGGKFKNASEASQSIVSDIRNAYKSNEAQAGAHFDFPLQQAGNEKIYEVVDPLISTQLSKAAPMMRKIGDLNVGKLFSIFENNPTFQNAHNLQSELGTMIGDLRKVAVKTPDEARQLSSLRSARKQLKDDINEFLERRDKTSNTSLLPSYKKGSELYEKNVSPYLSNPKLREITRGGKTVVPNVHKLFQEPYDLIERITGKTKEGPIKKILSDLLPETKKDILFKRVSSTDIQNPEKLLEELKAAEQEGYSHLFDQKTKESMKELEKKLKSKSNFKFGAGLVGTGAAVGTIEELMRRNLFK